MEIIEFHSSPQNLELDLIEKVGGSVGGLQEDEIVLVDIRLFSPEGELAAFRIIDSSNIVGMIFSLKGLVHEAQSPSFFSLPSDIMVLVARMEREQLMDFFRGEEVCDDRLERILIRIKKELMPPN